MSDTADEVRHERFQLQTSDGVALEAELVEPTTVGTIVVACHPHPQYGGSMEANVVEAMFRRLPLDGAAVVRFNFRGANGSGGEHDGGQAERLDVVSAIDEAIRRWPGVPLVLAGYSFGADVALAVDHAAIAAWLAVAPPLRIVDKAEMGALTDERPTFFVGAAHDQFNPYRDLLETVGDLPGATVVEAPGADHFFAIGLDEVVTTAQAAIAAVS